MTSQSLTIQPPFVIAGRDFTIECTDLNKFQQLELYPTGESDCVSVHRDGSCDKVCHVASSGSCSFTSDNEMKIQLTIDKPKNTRWICVFTTKDQEVEYLYKDIVVGKLYDIPVYSFTFTCTLCKS